MIPQTQSRSGYRGRCFSACLASILEIPERAVPFFEDQSEDIVSRWLRKFGYRLAYAPVSDIRPMGYHLICGISPRGREHCVVGRAGRIVHDPHPQDGTGRGLVESHQWGLLIPI